MELNGMRNLAVPRETVWQALNDPEILRACIPGCSELTGSPADGFEATVTQKVGPVKATFKGGIELSDVVEPESYRITGQGKGGAAGFAKGSAAVKLVEIEGGTELNYEVEARVGGKLAQIGSRIIAGVAKKLTNEFFERFQAEVEGPESTSA
ncbi:MAG: carbon monoxide dehydrogenase subunit G [Rhodobacteraceae bacterium]|nr:carbon monoxide dehydrogenase subunit G [Paracoccaceae bacterium]